MRQNTSETEYLERYACMDWRAVEQELYTTPPQSSNPTKKHLSSSNATLRCLRRAFINPFTVILFILGIITFLTDLILSENSQKNPISVAILFAMIIVSGIVRLTQELKAKRISEELTKLVQSQVLLLDGEFGIEVSSEELKVGDRIRLKAGDRVPADLRLTAADTLFVSQSTITGESQLCEKTAETVSHPPKTLSDYRNILFCGTTVIGGTAEGIVLATGNDTVYGGLHLPHHQESHSFDRGANSIAWVLIHFMLVMVPLVFVICGVTKGNWLEAFLFSLSVAVGLTPELLPMVVNACLAKGSYSMGKKQTIVKNINAMQSFGSVDVLCVDKTGTLTGDKIILEYYTDILGNECQKTLDYGYLASHYHTGIPNHLDAAICKAEEMPHKADYYQRLTTDYQKLNEQPFDYDQRCSSVMVKHQNEKMVILKGSIDEIVSRCSYAEYNGTIIKMEENPLSSVHAVVDEMLEDGMKVIAVAYRVLSDDCQSTFEQKDFVLLGYLGFFDAPKQSAASAIQKLHGLNINIKVLTGDNRLIAESVCKRLGIQSERILTGNDIDRLSENELPVQVEKTNIFAELTPKQKAHLVEVLQRNGHSVGFLGDGMNDLPAMLQADVGISVENAAEALKESADVILLKKDLNVLEEGVLEGRKAFANMTKYIKITASSNFGNICAIVLASILLPFFPMTSVQLLLLNLLYDLLCLILPWDRVDEGMLSRPLEWSGKKLGSFMTFFGPISSIFDLLTFGVLYFVICPLVCGGSFEALGTEGQAAFISLFQTGWFLESMWTQILILQLLRTEQLPFVQSRPAKSVVLISALGIVLYSLLPVTPFGTLLGLCRLPLMYFIFLIGNVVLYLLMVTAAKSLYIRKHKRLI